MTGKFDRQPRDPKKFALLTENRDLRMPEIELRMLWKRYDQLARLGRGKDVLDIGSGQSLAWEELSQSCRTIVTADISFENLVNARDAGVSAQVNCSAENLPFLKEFFDVISALEMIYYLENSRSFLLECHRVLRPGGKLFITMPNPSRRGFHKSPHAIKYFNVDDIHEFLNEAGFGVEVFGAFRIKESLLNISIAWCFSVCETLHLVPKSLRGRSRIKRVLQGKLTTFESLQDIEKGLRESDFNLDTLKNPSEDFSVLYVIGTKNL